MNRKLTRHTRRSWRSLLLLLPLIPLMCPTQAFAKPAAPDKTSAAPKPPGNHAIAAALIDVNSGRILFSQRGDEPMLIASLTKIMTAIVAIDHGNLDSLVKVSARAAGKEGSSIYLKAGEKMTLRNVLYGMMLRSGNDAAVAVAEHIGGSVEGFAFLMNKKAEEIGLEHSHFMNPSGLDEKGHYSSANDLAKLTAYALHNPDFSNIVKTRVKSAPNPNESWDYKWVNKNKMLTMYEGADGVKTGYTKQALRTLVSSATRGNQQLVAVTLRDGDDWLDHRNLLDFGFANYPLVNVVNRGDTVNGYPLQAAASFGYPFAAGEREKLEIRLVPEAVGTPSYKLGYRGHLRLWLDDKPIGNVPLIEATPQLGQATPDNAPSLAKSTPRTSSFVASVRASLKALFLQGGS
jgi:serine-type D-Ala-D-Ala carboxypeptidase (penicillin-binding protein 5/6)